jgi:hypothetical protein
MGNSLDRCHKLFTTYCTVNVVSLRAVRDARKAGSEKLAAEQKALKGASKSGRESEHSGLSSPNASSKIG